MAGSTNRSHHKTSDTHKNTRSGSSAWIREKIMRLTLARWKNGLAVLMTKISKEKSAGKVFDDIYLSSAWGKGNNGGKVYSGDGSHDPILVKPYQEAVLGFLQSLHNPSVLDLGCGDFNVSGVLAPMSKHYFAVDVSQTVIDVNESKFAADNLTFLCMDAVAERLPEAEVVIIRQVLQHLSNDDIKHALSNCIGTTTKYLIVTEHLPRSDQFIANIDKPTGVGIRLKLGSGVDLEQAPFSLLFKQSTDLLSINIVAEGLESRVVTKIYEL